MTVNIIDKEFKINSLTGKTHLWFNLYYNSDKKEYSLSLNFIEVEKIKGTAAYFRNYDIFNDNLLRFTVLTVNRRTNKATRQAITTACNLAKCAVQDTTKLDQLDKNNLLQQIDNLKEGVL